MFLGTERLLYVRSELQGRFSAASFTASNAAADHLTAVRPENDAPTKRDGEEVEKEEEEEEEAEEMKGVLVINAQLTVN